MRDLDIQCLRTRWRHTFRKPPLPHVPKHILFGVLAYRLQADVFGDLDPARARLLDQNVGTGRGTKVAQGLTHLDRNQSAAAPGTTLSREWKGRRHRLIVMANGYTWNGKTYKSLSAVAFAITGTRWNGPRFFGLRSAHDPVRSRSDK